MYIQKKSITFLVLKDGDRSCWLQLKYEENTVGLKLVNNRQQ